MPNLSPTARRNLIRLLEVETEIGRRDDEAAARDHLRPFVRQAWRVLNPGRPLEWLPYLDGICLHLEAVRRRDLRLRRLLITQPPNTLKSTIALVCYPAWIWATDPAHRFLCAASDGPLASRDALAMRDLVESDWYQRSFRPNWVLRPDQATKTWYTNTAGGHRISYSVNTRVIGRKGDTLLVDDPDDAQKVWSQAERDSVHHWHDHAFGGRIADERTSPHIVVGQRVHPEDLIGHLKKQGGWVELRLSEEYDPSDHCQTPIWSDGRRRPGEWLRPSRFGPDEKADAIARLGEDGYAAQHRQAPRASAGTWFDEGRLAGILPEIPMGTTAVRYWDTAASTGETACETAGALVGKGPDGRFIIADLVHGKWQPVDRDQVTVVTAHADRRRPGVTVHTTWIEQEPGGSGLSDVQSMIRKLAGFHAKAWKETGDKDVRARPLAGQWQAGNVLLVAGAWVAPFLAQMRLVPGAKRGRDMVDAATGGFNRLTEVPAGDGRLGLPDEDQRYIGGDVPADVWH